MGESESSPGRAPSLVKVAAVAISDQTGKAKAGGSVLSPAAWQQQLQQQVEQKDNVAKEKKGQLRSRPKRKIKPLYWDKVDVETATRRRNSSSDHGTAETGAAPVRTWWEQPDGERHVGRCTLLSGLRGACTRADAPHLRRHLRKAHAASPRGVAHGRGPRLAPGLLEPGDKTGLRL